MIANVLELANLMILFKVVLGCGFRKNRGLLFIGGFLAAGYLLLYQIPVLADFVTTWGPYVIWPFYVLMTVSLFEGKVWMIAGLSITLWLFQVTVAGFFENIAILMVEGDLMQVNFRALYYAALILITAGLLVTGRRLGKQREIIRNYLYAVNPIVWIVVIGCLDIMRIEWTYSGGLTDYEIEMVRSYNLIKDAIFGIGLLVLLSLLGAYSYQRKMLQSTIRLNEKCIAEQAEQYAFMGEKEQELRQFRHDYNRHFFMIRSLLQQKKYGELAEYLDELETVSERLRFLSTGNMICDTIVNQFYLLCREKGIGLSVTGKVNEGLSISQTALCVILSNALENAVEATERCKENREIILEFRNEKNLLFMDLRNPTEHPLSFNGEGLPETNKEDKRNHGIGTRNMRAAAEKNYGDLCWEYDPKGFVITKVVLPCEEDRK